MELEPASTVFQPVDDRRPKMPPPPPVQLVAINDVALIAAAGLEKKLDDFYVGLLFMERDPAREVAGSEIVYRTANVRLRLRIVERRGPREDLPVTGIIVPLLNDVVQRLNEAKIEFVRQRTIWAGVQSIFVTDPAGNSLEISEIGALI